MLRQILSSLKRIGRSFLYFLVTITIAIAIIALNSYFLESPAASNSQTTESNISIQEFSEIISKIETKWEGDYERYFQRNFSNQSKSARQIARRLKEIKSKTDINPAVIWAIPKEDFLELLLITPDRKFVLKKIWGANRPSLTRKIEELEMGILDRHSLNYLPPARLIYQWLFQPLEPYLEAENIDTLLLCTGSTLRSLPFAALHDGKQFVIEKYNITRIPAFNLTDTSYQAPSQKKVLATGASEFADLPSLPGVKIELNTIVPKLWSGQKLLEEEFTIDNLKNIRKQGNFEIVHIASHARFNPGSPEDSYIQFSDRKLNLNSLASLKLDIPQVDLLVLSACETALGNEKAEFGFAGLAMQGGVKSALATLWAIDDSGTIVLMSEFYQALKSTPIKAEALRKAQISMLKKRVFVENNRVRGSAIELNLPSTTVQNRYQNFNHPYYWAGFSIIGNPW